MLESILAAHRHHLREPQSHSRLTGKHGLHAAVFMAPIDESLVGSERGGRERSVPSNQGDQVIVATGGFCYQSFTSFSSVYLVRVAQGRNESSWQRIDVTGDAPEANFGMSQVCVPTSVCMLVG